MNQKQRKSPVRKNPVAKHAHQFNRCIRFKDKTRYTRKNKHKQKSFAVLLYISSIAKGFLHKHFNFKFSLA
ncbi:MAG: DUF7230 family protein [bacterium]